MEEVFVRQGVVFHLHVGGQVIRTTPEHPYWVQDQGWTAAGELEIGDLISTEAAGGWVAVQEVLDNGQVETVYNFRVADYHTYFVGATHWGFSVWVHNQCKFNSFADARDFWNGYRRWANGQNLNGAQTTHVWGLIKEARKNAGSLNQFYAEVSGLTNAIEQFGSNGRGFRLLARSFGYGAGQRKGIDLVFRQRIGNQVIDHVVEAKGFNRNSIGGFFAMLRGQGSRKWSTTAMQRAMLDGNRSASALYARDAAGNVRYYTSFLDQLHSW